MITPHHAKFYALMFDLRHMRKNCYPSHDVTNFQDDLDGLKGYVDEHKYIDISMVYGILNVLEGHNFMVQDISTFPFATMLGDYILANNKDESDTVETDQENLGTC